MARSPLVWLLKLLTVAGPAPLLVASLKAVPVDGNAGHSEAWPLFPRTSQAGSLRRSSQPGVVPSQLDVLRARVAQPAIDMGCRVSYPKGNILYVAEGSVTPFVVDASRRRSDVSVVILPGGGNMFLAWEREGVSVAKWLNSIGISAFVVQYRVPKPLFALAQTDVMDAQRAMSLVRRRAKEFGLSAKHIGIMGFSEGANVVTRLSGVHERAYRRLDKVDDERFAPDFQLLLYGHVTDTSASGGPPPTFVANAADDPCVDPNGARDYCDNIKRKEGTCERHLYPNGGHGFGVCDVYTNAWSGTAACGWLEEAEAFLGRMGATRV